MFKKIKRISKIVSLSFFVYLAIPSILILASILIIQLAFLNRIYPFIQINNVWVSGLTIEQANQKVIETLNQRSKTSPEFEYKDKKYKLELAQNTDYKEITPETLKAYQIGRDIFYPLDNVKATKPVNFFTQISIDPRTIQGINQIAQEIDETAISSQIRLIDGDIIVTPSLEGLKLDQESLKQSLTSYIQTGEKISRTTLPVQIAKPTLTYSGALNIKKTLDKLKLNPLNLKVEAQDYYLYLNQVLGMADLKNGKTESDTTLSLDQTKLEGYLSLIGKEVDIPVIEPQFKFDQVGNNGKGKVVEFQPPQEGKKLNLQKSAELINQTLSSGEVKSINLSIDKIQTKNKLVNELGIKELLGRGISNFAGSIPNRIYNVTLTASKLNGVLVPPGETFSFLDTVGDISADSGYKQAYIIKNGRTVLDDGGGVCQDSTTLFRSVLNAGLPVIARTAHAYRVGYYEQGFPPGLDATVFSPTVDFKFKNDTKFHILIQTYTYGNTLYVDLYGTSDERVSEVSTPAVTNKTPPPPELRQDDPTLPRGQVKQVDFSAEGAQVVFTRKVTRGGEALINETYKSNYRPWQAVFLVGTKD